MSIDLHMSIEDYHAAPGLSNSGLRTLAKSPAHFYGLHLDPERPPREPKPGQLEGQLAHCAILEPSEFDVRYAVGPDISRSSRLWKDFAAAVEPAKIAIKPDQAATAMAQARSVHRDPDVAKLFSVGRAEVSVFWTDDETGAACRCRPDWVHPVGNRGVILVDVKTCGDAAPDEFSRQIARKGYHGQAAWYSDGYEAATGTPVLGFVFVAVESEWPYVSSAVMVDDDGMAKGRAANRALLGRYAECKAANVWPAYGFQQVALPKWAA